MKLNLTAALAAVTALGQRAVAIAQDADKPDLLRLHNDAMKSLNEIETDAEQVGEATIEAFAVKMFTPVLGTDGAQKFAAGYVAAGEAWAKSQLGFSPTPVA